METRGDSNWFCFFSQAGGWAVEGGGAASLQENGGSGNGYGNGEDKPSEVREPLEITLRTKRAIPLGSAADVDSYLDGLRKQLMNHIDKGESVIIIS